MQTLEKRVSEVVDEWLRQGVIQTSDVSGVRARLLGAFRLTHAEAIDAARACAEQLSWSASPKLLDTLLTEMRVRT